MSRALFYGDCLTVMRNFADEIVDLIYLDPPFNSNRDYNTFLAPAKTKGAGAQIAAFEDTWHWGEQAQEEFNELLKSDLGNIGGLMMALQCFLGCNDLMAYLVMLTSRLVEMHRVLKSTGSLYLHCDPTASHYVKLLLDGIFGPRGYRTEISWRRSSAHNDAKQGRTQYGNVRDTIFFYTKGSNWTWHWQFTPYSKEYVDSMYSHIDENGRRFRLSDLTAAKPGGDTSYDFHGTKPYKGRYWAYSQENMEKFYQEGRIYFPKNGGTPSYKRFLDEMPGVPLQNDWADIKPASGAEYLGYPTQKPVALLERIISASSNPGDTVLDPFCGCGTAIHAAEKLGRSWIGIDITHLAISLISQRMKSAFPDAKFNVTGTPVDVESARYLAENNGLEGRYQFQYWALSLVGALPYKGKKKGADGGIDGVIWAYDSPAPTARPFRIIVSVKSGKIPPTHVRELTGLLAVQDHTNTQMAVLIAMEGPSKAQKQQALAAGKYAYPGGKEFPRVQIFTIEELLAGARPDYIDYGEGKAMNRQAPKEHSPKAVQGSLLDQKGD